MSTNVGGVEFGVAIPGVKARIDELSRVQQELKAIEAAAKVRFKTEAAQSKLSAKLLTQAKFRSRLVGQITKGTMGLTAANKALNTELAKQKTRLTDLHVAQNKRHKRVMKSLKDELLARQRVASGFTKHAALERKLTRDRVNAPRKEAIRAGLGNVKSGFNVFAAKEQELNIQNAASVRVVKEAQEKLNAAHNVAIGVNKKYNTKLRATRVALAKLNRTHGIALEMNKKRTSKLALLSTKQRKNTQVTRKATKAIHEHNKAGHSMITRLTLMAAGYALAHAALRAFGEGLRLVTATFARGATISDDYAEGIATIAGMVAVTHEGMGGFIQRFEGVRKVMKKTMQESIRLAPTFRLSMEEITESYRELAQFGVIVKKPMVQATLATLSAMKEIAATTGSTTRQMRQEIQAMFSGQARATDQFARTVKRTMPEVWKQIVDPAKDANEKWKLVTKNWNEFAHAAIVASQTLRGQFEKLTIGISLVSEEALSGSGIYKLWVDRLITLNEKLFTSSGGLTTFGERVKTSFESVWNALNNLTDVITTAGSLLGDLYTRFTKLDPAILTTFKNIAKFAGIMVLLKTTLLTVGATVRILAGLTGLGALAKGFGKIAIALNSGAFVAGLARLKTFAISGVLVIAFLAATKSLRASLIPAIKDATKESNSFLGNVMKGVKNLKAFANEPRVAKFYEKVLPSKKDKKDMFAGLGDIKDSLKSTFDGLFDGLGLDKLIGSTDNKAIKEFLTALDELMDGTKKAKKVIDDTGDVTLDLLGRKGGGKDLGTKIVKSSHDIAKKFNDSYKGMMDRIAEGLKGTWTELFAGELHSVEDLFKSIMGNIVKTFQDAMTDMTTAYVKTFLKGIGEASLKNTGAFGAIAGAISQAFGGQGQQAFYTGSANQFGGTGQATVGLATGGLISEPVAGIGLNSGRRYKFGEQGQERILSTSQTRADQSMGGDIQVNITNNSSSQVKKSTSQPRFDGKKAIIDIILEDYASGGATKTAFGR